MTYCSTPAAQAAPRFGRFAKTASAFAMAAFLAATSGASHADSIEEAVRRGDMAAARAMLEQQIAGRPDAETHRQHLEGLIALRQGRSGQAARIFRALLEKTPDYAPARQQLAVALGMLGQEARAARRAEQPAATTDDARQREELLAEVTSGNSPRPGGAAFRFSFLPSSNVTGGVRSDTVVIGGLPFTLSDASREAGGIGLNLGVTAWYGWNLSTGWRATVSSSVDQRVYDTDLRADETELGLRLDFAHRGKSSALTFGPRVNILFQDGDRVRQQVGIGGRVTWRLSARSQLAFSGEWLDQSYPGALHRDGHKITAGLVLSWMASSRTMLTLRLPVEIEKAEADHLSHRDLGLSIGMKTRLDGRLGLGLDLSISKDRYDGAYPLFGIPREDRVTSLRVSVSHPKIGWKGVMPEFSVTRKHQDSNIPLHQTWTTDFGLSLIKRF